MADDNEHKMNAHRLAEEEAVRKHGTTMGPKAEDTYKRAYMSHLTRLRGEQAGNELTQMAGVRKRKK